MILALIIVGSIMAYAIIGAIAAFTIGVITDASERDEYHCWMGAVWPISIFLIAPPWATYNGLVKAHEKFQRWRNRPKISKIPRAEAKKTG